MQASETDQAFYWVDEYFPGANLMWTIEGGEIISAQDSGCSVTWWQGVGTLCVQEVFGENCFGDSACISVDVIGGVDESARNNALRIYPNPVREELRVALRNDQFGTWYLYAADGRLALTGTFNGKGFNVDVSRLAAGTYGLNVIAEGGVQTRGIVVKD